MSRNNSRLENMMEEKDEDEEERQMTEASTLEIVLSNVTIHSKEIPVMGKIEVYVDFPKKLPISMNTFINEKEFNREIFVNHLPPVIFYFHMPGGYPTKVLPNYMLRCSWLPDQALSHVCSMFDHLWEKTHWEVLFDWASFIRQDLIQFLDLDEGMSMVQRIDVDDPKDIIDRMMKRERDRDVLEGKYNPCDEIPDVVKNVKKLTTKPYIKSVESIPYYEKYARIYKQYRMLKQNKTEYLDIHVKRMYLDLEEDESSKRRKEVEKRFYISNKKKNDDIKDEEVKCDNEQSEVREDGSPFNEDDIYKQIMTRGRKPSRTLEKGEIDQRVITRANGKELLINLILDLNEKLTEKEFLREPHECEICFENFNGSNGVYFTPCQHEFCKLCISEYIKTKMGQPNLHIAACPSTACFCLVTEKIAKSVLDNETFDKYKKLVLKHKIESNPNLIYCPSKICDGVAVRSKLGKHIAYCTRCDTYLCTYCLKPSHGDMLCDLQSEERKAVIKEYQTANADRKLELEKIFTKKMILEWVNTDLSLATIKEYTKKCPNKICGCNIEKDLGCNKMTCINCKTSFCWLCNKILITANPYDHFMDVNSKCYQQLFPVGMELEFYDEEEDFEEFFEAEM